VKGVCFNVKKLLKGRSALSAFAVLLILIGTISGMSLILTGNVAMGISIVITGLGLGSFLLAIASRSQLLIPLLALNLLVFFNIGASLFIAPAVPELSHLGGFRFFSMETMVNHLGHTVLSGNLYNVLQRTTELVVLAIGMTFVTSASKGQDISVGAAAAVAGSVFVRVVLANEFSMQYMILAFLASCLVAVAFGAFNGTLVAVFKVQPMIATLILFTTGRAIAYWINGGATPTVNNNQWLDSFSRFIPGVPIHTPIITALVCGAIIVLVLKFTNLGLYTQSVGINEKSARLNGINPVKVKLLTFMILGLCVAIAAVTSVGRIGLINHQTILLGVEMDAILAVAIGGNALSGGKFKLAGSVIGAYVIQGLTETLYTMMVSSTVIQAYKAVAVILLVILGSPVVKEKIGRWRSVILAKKEPPLPESG